MKNKINENFISAVKNSDFNKIKYFLTSPELEDHANINYKTDNGWNALNWAILNSNLEIVKYLLSSKELKERINIDNPGNPPIVLTSLYGENGENLISSTEQVKQA